MPSARPCGFSPDVAGVGIALVCSPSRSPHSPVRRPPRTTFAGAFSVVPGVPVFATRVCAAWPARISIFASRQRSWDSCPSQLCSGRTVPRASSAAEAHLSFDPSHPLDSFSSRYRPCDLSSNSISNATTVDQDAANFDSWALTRPSSLSAALSLFDGGLMLPWALPLSGLGTPIGAAQGARPRRVHRPSPFRFRRLSALELLAYRLPCRNPAGSPDQSLPDAPALQRFRRPMPCSSGVALPDAGRTSRMRFFTC